MATDHNFKVKKGLDVLGGDVNLGDGFAYKIDGSTVVDSSRNLTNIGTISTSGNITSAGRGSFSAGPGGQGLHLNSSSSWSSGTLYAPGLLWREADGTNIAGIRGYVNSNGDNYLTLGTGWLDHEVTISSTTVSVSGSFSAGGTIHSTGNLSTSGTITTPNTVTARNTGRQTIIGNSSGNITTKGASGGWAFGYHALGSSGTDHGGFGFLGSSDTFSYYYIGANYSSGTNFRFHKNGTLKIGTTTILDSSRSLTNIHDIIFNGVVRSTNNANVDGPNFNVSTTNKSTSEYAYRVDRSGSVVGGIRIDGRLIAPEVTINGSSVTSTLIGNWNTAYSWGNHASAGYLTSYTETDTLASVTGRGATTTNAITTGAITSTGNIQAQNATFTGTGDVTVKIIADTDNVTETDNPTLGFSQDGNTAGTQFVLGLESSNDVAFPGSKVNSPYIHANVNSPSHPLSIANNGKLVAHFDSTSTNAALTVAKFSNITGTNGSTILNLKNYMGSDATSGDLSQQKSFIDFQLLDSNGNEVPQVRIGAEVGENGDANSQVKEGSGAFVVYTNDAESVSGDAGASLTEKLRVDYQGYVGIGTTSPGAKLDLVNGHLHLSTGYNLSWGGNYNTAKPTISATGSALIFYPTGNSDGEVIRIDADGIDMNSYNLTEANNITASGNIRADGAYQVNGQTVIDSSRNLTNIGTISSGAITSSGTLNLTSGNIRLRNNVTGDGQTIRDIDFLNSATEGTSDDRAVIIRARTSAGSSTTRGGKLFLYTRQANGSGFNETTIDHSGNMVIAGNLYVPQFIYHGGDTNTYIQFTGDRVRIAAGGTVKFDSNNTYQTTAAPSAVSITSSSIVSETVEIVFGQSSTSGVSRYEIWSDGGGSDFSLIGKINAQDAASSMSFVDTTFADTGTINYRVYAVRYGIYSTAATTSVSFTQPSLDVTNFSAIADLNNFYLQYEKPDTRFLDHIEIYVDTDASSSNLARSNASLIYSGDNSSYMYTISASDRDSFHQFWVECVGV